MKNKRGQMGKLITAVPVFILLVVLAGLFIWLSSALSLRAPSGDDVFLINSREDLLLQSIELDLDNGVRNVLVFDAYVFYENGLVEREVLEGKLGELLENEGECMVLTKKDETEFVIEKASNENVIYHNRKRVEEAGAEYSKYGRENLLSKVEFVNSEGGEVFVEYYLGRCI